MDLKDYICETCKEKTKYLDLTGALFELIENAMWKIDVVASGLANLPSNRNGAANQRTQERRSIYRRLLQKKISLYYLVIARCLRFSMLRN